MISADVWKGILIPFLGTSLGAGCVYFMKEQLHRNVQRGLTGFAAGVMVAASIWSLLIPALEESAALGHFAFVPVSGMVLAALICCGAKALLHKR